MTRALGSERHPERSRNRAISFAILDRYAADPDGRMMLTPAPVVHTRQLTSFGGSGTTALGDHLLAAGVDLPATPGQFPFKHQRTPPASAAVPSGFRALYLVGDPRDAVMSVFRRGFQDGHYVGMHGRRPDVATEARFAGLDTFLAAGIDDFAIADHVEQWLGASDRSYPIMVVRFDRLAEAWPRIRDFFGLPGDDRGLPTRARASDWRALPRAARQRIDRMYGELARRVDALPAVTIIGGGHTDTGPDQPRHRQRSAPAAGHDPLRVSFVVPSARRPIGGVMSMFEYANALARRGHEVNLVHVPTIAGHIESREDLNWFDFDPRVRHHVQTELDVDALPPADFVELSGIRFFTGLDFVAGAAPRSNAGLPFVFLQAWNIFPETVDRHALATPGPKLCVARWLLDVARANGVPEQEIAHVPYGLRHDKYRVVLPVRDRRPVVSMLYSVHALKGAGDGIAALARVKAARPEVRVVLFANQPPIHEIPAGFEFHVNPPQDQLVEHIYNETQVFLAPSVLEGFGFCPVEAMACGAALVTTANGGSDDYADESHAIVVPPRDVDGMAAGILALLSDAERRVRYAERGRAVVRDRFDWDRSGEILEAVLCRYRADPRAHGVARVTDASWSR